MLWPALAGGLGWGIRGQYGHETGAMMAGLLVGLTLATLWCREWTSRSAARAVALMTVAIGFGGSETYGQTVGLTHDEALVGNWEALRWGLLGLAIKGGVWIGFAGAFLGMGLGGVRYRALEMLAIFGGMLVLMWVGIGLINEPYDPVRRILPRIYFSDDWRWEPGALLKPRRERWGGLWLALLGLVAYVGWVRRDRLAWRLAGWAMLGGALGFPLGQCVQAFHAWNRELFRTGILADIDPVINWWNMMETTFGAVFGAVLGLGLWLNRAGLREGPTVGSEPGSVVPNAGAGGAGAFGPPRLRFEWEWCLLAIYAPLLVSWEFLEIPVLDAIAEPGITMGLIPATALVAGRCWPYWITLPLTVIPLAGKTLRQMAYKDHLIDPVWGWLLLVILPVTVLGVLAWRFQGTEAREAPAGRFLRAALLANVWVYFSLNHVFFHFPWPWRAWTYRTPNDLIYLGCAVALTWLAVKVRSGDRRTSRAP